MASGVLSLAPPLLIVACRIELGRAALRACWSAGWCGPPLYFSSVKQGCRLPPAAGPGALCTVPFPRTSVPWMGGHVSVTCLSGIPFPAWSWPLHFQSDCWCPILGTRGMVLVHMGEPSTRFLASVRPYCSQDSLWLHRAYRLWERSSKTTIIKSSSKSVSIVRKRLSGQCPY